MTRIQARDTQASCVSCHFTTRISTAGHVAHSLRLHSCERWSTISASKARGDAKRDAMDTTPKDCLHKHAQHQHGSYAAYKLDSCRCTPCRIACSTYGQRRYRHLGYGTWQPYVDAEPARQHVRALMAQGMGWKRVSAVAGLSDGTMTKLLYAINGREPSRRIRPEIAQRLLAVQCDLAPGALIDATGTWRRLEALVAIGWPKPYLAQRLGLARALQFDRKHVTAGNAAKVRTLYLELRDTPGTSTRARNDAKRHGYLSPLWWDDDTIDDPSHQPDTLERAQHWSDVDDIAVELACNGRDPGRALTRAEKVLAVLRLHEAGLNYKDIAARTGIHRDQAQRYVAEHGARLDVAS